MFLSSRSLARWRSGHDLPPTQGKFGNRFSLMPVFSRSCHTEMQRASRGEPWLLLAHDRQIYGHQPCNGYRTLSCVADSSRSQPASNLPALYPFRYGAYLYVDPRFCLRPLSGVHCCSTLAFGYPSPPSGWVWTLLGTCVTIPGITN